MKSNVKKIKKLLDKTVGITAPLFDGAQSKNAKKQKRRDKKLDRAELLCRRALALCREDHAKGIHESGSLLISCIEKLCDILFRRGRQEEAEPLLAEIYGRRESFSDCPSLSGCLAYYGSILCESGRYDEAAPVLDGFLTRVKKETSDKTLPSDLYAVCRGLGNAACAFTYSDTEEGYSTDCFVAPADLLTGFAGQGAEVGDGNLIKAAYYAASQQLFLTCYETVPGGSAKSAEEYAEKVLALCGQNKGGDLYYPAAMRLTALAKARDCRFADAAETCRFTLDECSRFKGEQPDVPFGSLQSISGDMNLLLGIMNYRVSQLSESIRYFEAAIAAYEADAKGRPLREVGYAEAETEIVFMSDAEKCAFAYKYIGLAKFSDSEKNSPDDCIQVMRRGTELLESVAPDEPYLTLLVSADYHIIAQMCERAGKKEKADVFESLSRERGMTALKALHPSAEQNGPSGRYTEHIAVRRRMALRLGLLELYADYTRLMIMLTETPFSQEECHTELAGLNFEMGECCRVLGKNESAVDYFNEVRTHTFDKNGTPYDSSVQSGIYAFSLVASASCLCKCGDYPKARRAFREFADAQCGEGGNTDKARLVRIAALSRDVGLNPSECAGYLHRAASAMEGEGGSSLTASELYNQEGICWYNANPISDSDGAEMSPKELSELADRYARREQEAFENALRLLKECDGSNEKVIDLMPSLHSNIGECYLRREEYGEAINHYEAAVRAFEDLFASDRFRGKGEKEQEPYLIQYALCFKALADIYNETEDDRKCMDALSRAIEVMERLHDPEVRTELAACLNARGVVHFRLGEYKENVADATRAIELKKDDNGNEINMAIMLKNRSDAYRELGDFKSMQSDLTESIDMLGKSELPDEMLNQFYGSHWFSMGVCQEGLNKIGKAADAYRRAAGYMDQSKTGDSSDGFMKALCHFRRAICLCRREEQEYYGALYEYNKAINLIEAMPTSDEKNENLRRLLSSRGSLYEAFREIDLARADFNRAESLRRVHDAVADTAK